MKIEMGYGDEIKGTAESKGTRIEYGGTDPQYVQSIVEDYQESTEKSGDDLLSYVTQHMKGRTWARNVGEEL